MTHFSKRTIPAIIFAALLSACGGQNTTDSATVSTVQKTAQTSQAVSVLSPASSSDLLASLAVTYPNGQLPAANAAQAAKELAQNPVVLHVTAANTATVQNAKSASVQPQAVAADYKAVTRIQNTTLTGAYFFTIYDTEQTAALAGNPNWKLEGPAFWASLASGTGLSPVHRFRNNINGSYLYTIYETEKADIQANYAATFFYEGVAWHARQTTDTGWSPLYRFRNLLNGTYLFSAFESEKDAIVVNYSAVFKLEGVAYYVRQDAPRYELVANVNGGGYYEKTVCVKDTVTGLIWQGQTAAGTGLRANNQYKTNYDSTTTPQKYSTATGTYVIPTQTEVLATTNSIGFKNAVNDTYLCGSDAWRLPTFAELSGIRKQSETPKIDNLWFPNTSSIDFYWTSSPDTLNGFGYAKGVGFGNGSSYSALRTGLGSNPSVRLVR